MKIAAALAFVTLLAAGGPASAVVSTQAQYRLGEADPGAVTGAPGNATTNPSVGTVVLNRSGAPAYTGATPLRIASTLAMAFNGSTDGYGGAVIGTATDDFGIEAWVRSNGRTTGNAAIAYNGNSGTSGWGLYRIGDTYAALFGGVAIFGGPAPVSGDWTHIAVVRSGGVATFYVNGSARGTTAAAPNAPAGGFGIGRNAVLMIDEFFDGQIDEVRYFTFAPGQFQVGDLNLQPPAQVPAGGGAAWLLLGLLVGIGGLAVLRLR